MTNFLSTHQMLTMRLASGQCEERTVATPALYDTDRGAVPGLIRRGDFSGVLGQSHGACGAIETLYGSFNHPDTHRFVLQQQAGALQRDAARPGCQTALSTMGLYGRFSTLPDPRSIAGSTMVSYLSAFGEHTQAFVDGGRRFVGEVSVDSGFRIPGSNTPGRGEVSGLSSFVSTAFLVTEAATRRPGEDVRVKYNRHRPLPISPQALRAQDHLGMLSKFTDRELPRLPYELFGSLQRTDRFGNLGPSAVGALSELVSNVVSAWDKTRALGR